MSGPNLTNNWEESLEKSQKILGFLKIRLEEAKNTLKSLEGKLSGRSPEVDDLIGKSNYNEDVLYCQIEAVRKKIEAIEYAISHPTKKCLYCKEPIPLEQLEEVPEAKICPTCIKKMQKQETQH